MDPTPEDVETPMETDQLTWSAVSSVLVLARNMSLP
jgi:hypothetical protein